MAKNAAVWFVAGFVLGVGSLLAGLALAPQWGPGATRADEASVPTASFDDTRAAGTLRTLTGRLDRVLGLLEAEFRPPAVEPSPSALTAALSSDLQTLRSQIELYKVQHNEKFPSVDEDGRPDPANFVRRLVSRTDQDGKLSATGPLGPYLCKFPSNPFVSLDPGGVERDEGI